MSPPRHRDWLRTVAVVWPVLLLRSFAPIESYDFWWHLKTGGLVVGAGGLPAVDPFSFTAAGTAWIDHSWLFQVVLFLAHQAGGFWALGLVRWTLLAIAAAAAAAFLVRRMRPAAAAAIILASLWIGCFRLTVRPDLVSIAGVAVVLLLLERFRERPGPGRGAAVWAVVPLWANLHIGAMVAPLLVLPYAVAALAARSGTRLRAAMPFVALFGAAVVGLGMTPWGFRPYAVALRIADMTGRPWARNLEWGAPGGGDFPWFYLSLTLLALLPLWRRRLPQPALFLAAAGLAAMALTGVRFIGLYAAALPFLIGAFAPLPGPWRGWRPRWKMATATIALAAVAIGWVAHVGSAHRFRTDFLRADRFPSGAVDFLERNEITAARLFNDVKFGGYLIWRRFPTHRVFIDGRNEVYEPLLAEVFTALDSAAAWQNMLQTHRIDAALLRYPPQLTPVVYPAVAGAGRRVDVRPFSTLYFPPERWALVYWDDAAMLFLQRSPRHAAVIERWEYRALRPDDARHLLARAGADDRLRDRLVAEIERKLDEDPTCRRARRLLATFAPAAPEAMTRNVRPGNND